MKFPSSKFGLKVDPRGAQVTMTHGGRLILGDVVGVYRREGYAGTAIMLEVRHFNGEPWPLDPHWFAVDVLERRAA